MPKIHTVNAINVGDSADKMIPPTPTTLTTMPASKAKIGFSIDSIVGSDDVNRSSKDYMKSHDFKYVNDYQTEIARALRLSDSLNTDLHKFRPEISKDVSSPQQITAGMFEYPMKRESSISPPSSYGQPTLPLPSVDEHRKSPRTPSPHRTTSVGPEPIPLQFMNGIHSANGPIRPMPIVPPPNLVDAKAMPPYLGMPPTAAPHPNAHLLQAQFQMAAALAQRQAVEQSFAPGGPFRHTPPPPHMVNPAAMGRESYQLYPWLLSRHGRIFPHGFPGSEYNFSRFIFRFISCYSIVRRIIHCISGQPLILHTNSHCDAIQLLFTSRHRPSRTTFLLLHITLK